MAKTEKVENAEGSSDGSRSPSGHPARENDAMAYPIIFNGDHAEYEAEHTNTPPEERPDWPLPSFDARDWAEAFCKIASKHGFKDAKGEPIDEGWMTTWFANALMRGYDEASAERGDRTDADEQSVAR